MNKRKLLPWFFLAAFISLCIVAVTRQQDIFDYAALRNYQPPARIVQLADQTTMRDPTRRVFYINHPELDDKTAFRSQCGVEEQSIVLGCYDTRRGIFLLDVTDPRLRGIIEVTAAHEILHAEYDRLSGSERKRIDRLTAEFFANLKDERIAKTVEQYRARDPNVVPTELHSILGTEIRDLTPELEQYFGRYFTDRKKVVAFSEQYEQTFVNLRSQVADYDAQLTRLKTRIEANESQIDVLGKTVEAQRTTLNELLANKQTEQYNAMVPGFNSLVNQYNNLVGQAKRIIIEYNSIVEKRNAAATTEQELAQAIDSNSVPAEQKQ